MRAIDHSLGIGTARAQQIAELNPWEMLEEFVVGVARPITRARKREEYAHDHGANVAKFQATQVGGPLCACGCGERVKSRTNGVWSQYRGNHWRRRGLHATH